MARARVGRAMQVRGGRPERLERLGHGRKSDLTLAALGSPSTRVPQSDSRMKQVSLAAMWTGWKGYPLGISQDATATVQARIEGVSGKLLREAAGSGEHSEGRGMDEIPLADGREHHRWACHRFTRSRRKTTWSLIPKPLWKKSLLHLLWFCVSPRKRSWKIHQWCSQYVTDTAPWQ